MSIYIKEIYKFLDSIAPFKTAMDFDNSGLLIGSMEDKVDKVILSLDINREVLDEAINLGAKLIISHHPVIFDSIKSLSSSSVPYAMASYGINAICAHTNLDMADKYGVNCCLAKQLLLKNIEPLSIYSKRFFDKIIVFVPVGYEEIVINAMCSNGAGKLGNYKNCNFSSGGKGYFIPLDNASPFIGENGKYQEVEEVKIEVICPPDKTDRVISKMLKVHPYEEPAFDVFEDKAIEKDIACGLIGELYKPMDCQEFALFIKNKLECNGLRYTEINKKIKKVAICSGAGGEYINFAIDKNADAFVTGEIKHHLILKANSAGIMVVDAGHFKTEDVVLKFLLEILKEEFPNIEFKKTSVFSDNIKYL